MTDRLTRRGLLGGLGGATAAGVLGTPHVRASAGPCTEAATPRPLAPVNREAAARHGVEYRAMPQAAVGVDVESMITMYSAAEVAARRARLIAYVWKRAGLPTRLPRVQTDVSVPLLTALPHLRRVDELSVPLAYGMSSKVYHVLPRPPGNGRLAVYHNGHGEPLGTMLTTVAPLLQRGYSVQIHAMPYMHWNAPSPAELGETSHDEFARRESASFSALTFFLEPVAVALNHAVRVHRPTSVQMVGLSGGGWTTTVYAAIDPRVTRSYPVAGSLPPYLRGASPNAASSIGDWEQRGDTLPGFYGVAGYLDLYVMAATGPGRRQLQILNRFDSCCFSGIGHRSYVAAVAHRAGLIGGGGWDLQEDATHDGHTISPYALSVILHDLDTRRDERTLSDQRDHPR
ncbi:hypothetical protein FB559_6744 [Actinoallomurus bryophytorum]|uniref:Uncharacterized protein n=1 Tax=Actinoallomurus bryophytorum TaxID=1490222 RepID=A0A543CVA3_9ACTN|nr:hypothetical protein [Actinoallomurus bryophytorum]TQM01001.1 hypothetical protein FB559_6744 [Actinoallomurus bryophytorum]